MIFAFSHKRPEWNWWRALLAVVVAVWCVKGAIERVRVSNENTRVQLELRRNLDQLMRAVGK